MRSWLLGLLALLAVPSLAASGFAPYEKAGFDALVKGGQTVVAHVHADW